MHHLSTVSEQNRLRCTREGLFDDEHNILIALVLCLLTKRTCVHQALLREVIEVNGEAAGEVQLWCLAALSGQRQEQPIFILTFWIPIAVTSSIATF